MLDISGRQVTVQPVASLAEQIYRKWVEDNRAYVSKISNNRLGYVHVRDMSEQALSQLYLDLDEREPVAEGRDDRHSQQQWRLRQRVCARRADAAAVSDDDGSQRPAELRRGRRWGNARWSCRRYWW